MYSEVSINSNKLLSTDTYIYHCALTFECNGEVWTLLLVGEDVAEEEIVVVGT